MPRKAQNRGQPPSPALRAVPIESLIPNPANPRRHPERQIKSLMDALERFGQPKPVVARAKDRMLLAGHGLVESAKRLGWTHINAVLTDWDERTASAFMLADNRPGELARDDADKIAALLAEMEPGELPAVGFSQEEADIYASISSPTDSESKISEIDVDQVADQFWITLNGPLKDQADILLLLEGFVKDYPEVELRLGTTNTAA